MNRLWHQLRRPTMAVFLGRAVFQGGQFAFVLLPSLVMVDREYNLLLLGITVATIAVAGVLLAFGSELVRGSTGRPLSHPTLQAAVLGVPLVIVSIAIAAVFGGGAGGEELAVYGLVAIAYAVLSGPTLVATLEAARQRFLTSAIIEALCGVALAIVSCGLVAAGIADPIAWAGALVAWAVGCRLVVWWIVQRGRVAHDRPSLRLLGEAKHNVLAARTLIGAGIVASAFNRTDYLLMVWLATDAETARYAIATRVVGPVLIALGSLNNSLFINQVTHRDDRSRIAEITHRASRRLALLTAAAVPVMVAGVWVLGRLSASIAGRDLLAPTFLLALSCVPFAMAIPWGYAMNAVGEERRWMRILLLGLAVDAVAVVAFGARGATWAAAAWLGTQTIVFVTTEWSRHRVGIVRQSRSGA